MPDLNGSTILISNDGCEFHCHSDEEIAAGSQSGTSDANKSAMKRLGKYSRICYKK